MTRPEDNAIRRQLTDQSRDETAWTWGDRFVVDGHEAMSDDAVRAHLASDTWDETGWTWGEQLVVGDTWEGWS